MSSDWSQNRAINDLEAAISAQAAAAASRQRAVERRIAAVQGDMVTKVNALTFQLNALVELGDLRDELTLYIPMRRARDAAVALTRAVLRGDGDLTYLRESPDLASDGDYWLVPAALAIVDGRQGVLHDDAAATALRLDRGRAAPFLVAVTTLLGHPELTTHLLGDCFDGRGSSGSTAFGSADGLAAEPSAPAASSSSSSSSTRSSTTPSPASPSPAVTNTERTIWRATAAGVLGADAVPAVQRAVGDRLAGARAEAWTEGAANPLAEAPRLGHLTSDGPDPIASQGTGAILGAWATWAERIGEHELRGGRAVGPADLGSAPLTGTPTGDDDPFSPPAVHRDLERVVMSLAGEGGPREREMLERIDLLQTHLGKAADREAQWWSAPHAGGVVELVVRDARGRDIDAAALVAPLLTPQLRTATDNHRDRLLATPPPSTAVRLVGTSVAVTATDDGEVAAERARSSYLSQPLPKPNLVAVGVLAAVGLVGAILAATQVSPGWLVLAVPMLVAAGVVYLRGLQTARAEKERRTQAVQRFADALHDARAKVRSEADALTADQESVRLGHAAVAESLARVRPVA
ncbi:hypothetical protein C8046_10540 [Serinibacter arcticus]|uniref:Uncharacterized protein n=1 Tax=Serinibacter arcticus TaxID=1655435 RepID=A0A2U1ZVM7_9MICO|nr:hypothetical protein [Serinibacter arcticus]PWD51021.1 hypothetical protein C8046_10540 [Serinibacter arcticus]